MRASAGSRLLPWALAPLVLAMPLLAGCALFRRSAQRPPFKKLSPPIAYEMMRDSPEMLVLDLRPAQEYNGDTGHLRRAVNIPLERLPYRLLEINPFREDTVLVYCRADDCGEKGIAVLIASGFESAVLMEGGIDAWIREGFKTVLPNEIADRPRQPADGKGAMMPKRPGETDVAPKQEVPVKPPPRPPPPLTTPALLSHRTPAHRERRETAAEEAAFTSSLSPGGRECGGREGVGGVRGRLAAPRQIG